MKRQRLYFKSFFNKLSYAEFVPTLKSLLGNPVYITFLCVTIIQFNSLIGMVTYKPKYIEQHYGQSASKANFLMGKQTVLKIQSVLLICITFLDNFIKDDLHPFPEPVLLHGEKSIMCNELDGYHNSFMSQLWMNLLCSNSHISPKETLQLSYGLLKLLDSLPFTD